MVAEIYRYPAGPAPDADVVRRLADVPAAVLSDCMARSAGSVGVLPVGSSLAALNGRSMAGPALTVRTRPGDNLAIHVALEAARPGDVLVIDARGDTTYAALGGLMSRYATTRGVAGLVVNGAVRDYADLSAGDVPVFARGLSHMGPFKTGPGELHGPVSIGGMVVNDADLVVGDADGLVVLPAGRAAQILAEGERLLAREREQQQAIDAGTWDRSWLADVSYIEMTGTGSADAG
jgi:regulator of RNase E activity RraA